MSGFSGSIWPPGSASLARSIAMFQQSIFGAFNTHFLRTAWRSASTVFMFAKVWFRLFMVSSSSFLEISDSYPVQATKVVWRNQGLISYVQLTFDDEKGQEEDKYHRNCTRLYPTLPTQLVMLYHPWRTCSGSSRGWELWNRSSVMENVFSTVFTESTCDQGGIYLPNGEPSKSVNRSTLNTFFRVFLDSFKLGNKLDGI